MESVSSEGTVLHGRIDPGNLGIVCCIILTLHARMKLSQASGNGRGGGKINELNGLGL